MKTFLTEVEYTSMGEIKSLLTQNGIECWIQEPQSSINLDGSISNSIIYVNSEDLSRAKEIMMGIKHPCIKCGNKDVLEKTMYISGRKEKCFLTMILSLIISALLSMVTPYIWIPEGILLLFISFIPRQTTIYECKKCGTRYNEEGNKIDE